MCCSLKLNNQNLLLTLPTLANNIQIVENLEIVYSNVFRKQGLLQQFLMEFQKPDQSDAVYGKNLESKLQFVVAKSTVGTNDETELMRR